MPRIVIYVRDEYDEKVRATAIEAVSKGVLNWDAGAVAAAADKFIERGFGHPGLGVTARVAANVLRAVVPSADFSLAKETALYINIANRELTATESFDQKPWRCTLCSDRFATKVTPRTHFSHHDTVFDPRSF